MKLIIIGAVVMIAVIWGITVKYRLAAMSEQIDRCMKRIVVQLTSCAEVLETLLELAKRYVDQESAVQLEAVRIRYRDITHTSFPEDVPRQERMIGQTLDCIAVVAEHCPELKTDEKYQRCMRAVDRYEKMIRTGSLIYNDSVAKLNRELRLFPVSLIGKLLGFRSREYLEIGEAEV